jgi:[protein-PII] uridylyltransferase
VDVFYVTDLLGAKIGSPTRQAAIKRPLLALFASPGAEGKAAAHEAVG